MLRSFICAVQFLTVIPIRGDSALEEKDLARSMIFYPLVGLMLGSLMLLVYRLGLNFLPPAVSLVLAYVCGIAATGGLHLDGFADLCDSFYAGKDRTQILAIMKDSHVGAMAVLGLVCLLMVKLALLFSLLWKQKLPLAFLLVPAVSRWVMVIAASFTPYARTEGGTAQPFVQNAGWIEALLASVLGAVIFFAVYKLPGILISAAVLAAVFIVLQWIKSKINGITGDVLGGLNEISEVLVLLLMQF
jgi:adenosylcobinamide-GDP ribazoletransferase